jgi:hypothetical protein
MTTSVIKTSGKLSVKKLPRVPMYDTWVSGIPMRGDYAVRPKDEKAFEEKLHALKGVTFWKYPSGEAWGKPAPWTQYIVFADSKDVPTLNRYLGQQATYSHV